MKTWWQTGLVLLMIGLMGVMCGCESSSDDGGDEATVDTSGTWSIVNDAGEVGTLQINQNGNAIAASLTADGITVPATSASISGDDIELIFNLGFYSLTLNAEVSGSAMTGTYDDTDGGSGTFSGTRR